MSHNSYYFKTKEEIQEETYNFLNSFIKDHTYFTSRVIITEIGLIFGFKRQYKDVTSKVFYKKLVQNVRIMLNYFVEQNKIIRYKKGKFVVNKNNII